MKIKNILAALICLPVIGASFSGCTLSDVQDITSGIDALVNGESGTDTDSADGRAMSEGPSPVIMNDARASSASEAAGTRTYTGWDASQYPDLYRITGKALIDDDTLKPGDVVYGGFDSLGRTLPVKAYLNAENFAYGKRDRGDISDIYPSGWSDNREVEVTFPSGTVYHGYFWNRSHLLAHSLGGEDTAENMVTGTRAQNVGDNRTPGGMAYTETLARGYLAGHPDGTLYYFVTPVYEGNGLVPRSVFVDMKSGDGEIDCEVEVYNVMPGFTIDYATGEYQEGGS